MNLENLNLNKTSTVDPHITPEDAYAQVPRISKATGLPLNLLNVLVFAPNYVNVLEVNVELISGYPDVYQEFVNKKLGGLN